MYGTVQVGYGLNTSDVYTQNYGLYLGEYYSGEHLEFGNLTGINRAYKFDPYYAGDLSEAEAWLYGRIEEAYARVQFCNFSAFLGRKYRNWGPINSYSLVLSDYVYSYDHLLLAYDSPKGSRLSLIYASLDELHTVMRDRTYLFRIPTDI